MNIKDKIEQLKQEGSITSKNILMVRLYNGHDGDEVVVWEGNMDEDCPYGDLECHEVSFEDESIGIVYLDISTETLKNFILSLTRK